MTKKQNMIPILAAIITSIIFGLSFLFSKRALGIVDTFTLLSFRFLVAFLTLSLLIGLKVIKVSYKGKNMKNLMLLGIMQPIVYFIFETYGIQFSSSSQAGLMVALIPIVVTLLSAYILKEKASRLQIFFIVLSVAGVAFIIAMNGASSGSSTLFGTILLLGAVFSGAIFNILSRKFSKEFTPMELTYAMMGLGAVAFNLLSIFNHIKNKELSQYFDPLGNKDFLIALLYLGILSSIIAFFLINYTLSKIEASKSAVFSNLATIVAVVAGVILLKESFHYYHFIGGVMILLGVWGTNYYGIEKEPKVS